MDLSGSWSYIQNTAKSRLANNKTIHHDYRYGDGIEVIGVAGEIAARRYLGLDENVHVHFDHGVDINFMGVRIDVKATVLTPKIIHRYLQWPANKRVKADIVLLTAVDPVTRQCVILGYATKNEILNAKVNTQRPTTCYEISVPELHPVYELVAGRLRKMARAF
jgi:hypothetical protein